MLKAFKNLALSQTARDTYTVFGGNVITTGLNVLFFIAVVRALAPSDFGLFSSLSDFIILAAAVADLGIGASLSRFLPRLKLRLQRQFLKTAFRVVGLAGLTIFALLFFTSSQVGQLIFTTSAVAPLVRVAAIGIFAFLVLGITTSALQAKREFRRGVYTEVFYIALKASIALLLLLSGQLTLTTALLLFALAPILGIFLGGYFLNPAFLFVREAKGTFLKLFRFTRFMAVSKIAGTVSGRVGTIMILNLAGAYETGIYSAAFRFASVYPLIAGSFGTVLAPRFASFGRKEEMVSYIRKVALMTGAIVLTMPVLALIAKPLILLIAGTGYSESAQVLRWLLLAMVPFVATIPAASVVIYGLKKPQVFAASSIFQLALFVLLNIALIPRYAILGLVASMGISNLVPLVLLGSYAFYGLRKY